MHCSPRFIAASSAGLSGAFFGRFEFAFSKALKAADTHFSFVHAQTASANRSKGDFVAAGSAEAELATGFFSLLQPATSTRQTATSGRRIDWVMAATRLSPTGGRDKRLTSAPRGLGSARRWQTQTSSANRAYGDGEATMKIRPLQDRIVVKRLEGEAKTKGGIIIPDSAKEKPIEGKVIAVGNGKILKDGKARPVDVKVGDTILFGKYSGTEVKIDGEEHLLIREDDVLAVTNS